MKRFALVMLFASSAFAQPAPKKPAAPVDPYAQPKPDPKKAPAKPADPYADPVLGPAPPPGGVKQPPKTDPKKPTGPADPYADPKGTAPKTGPVPPKAPVKADPPKADPPKTPAKPIDPYGGVPARVGIADVPAIQGLLAVQRLDGWLLFDRDGANPIARRLVAPEGNPSRPWFYMIPAKGQPMALVHDAEKRSFEHLPGTKLTYQGYRDYEKQIRILLKNAKTVAVEYSPKAAVPGVSRVDAGTMEIIRGAGVQVRSSDTLVQFTKAIWGDAGRTAHLVAVHHAVELRKEAFAYIAKQLRANAAVTEYDVQQRLTRGLTMRGLTGPAPVVAAGVNTADPYYVPNASKTATIKRGDLIVISVAAKVDKPEGVYVAHTWLAVADAAVRDDIKKAFETVTLARDQAIALVTDRTKKNRPVTGAEVDQATRAFIKKAGFGDKVMHRTGHSIDNDFQGSGADLDDYEVKDTRILTPGTGFTVGPGLYTPTNFGVRTEVSVYLAPTGPEVTTPAQDYIELLLR
jgi:Xaa-Pro dipeptidase